MFKRVVIEIETMYPFTQEQEEVPECGSGKSQYAGSMFDNSYK
jgi:hypothetical protein